MVAFERIAKTGIMNVRGAQYAAHEQIKKAGMVVFPE